MFDNEPEEPFFIANKLAEERVSDKLFLREKAVIRRIVTTIELLEQTTLTLYCRWTGSQIVLQGIRMHLHTTGLVSGKGKCK